MKREGQTIWKMMGADLYKLEESSRTGAWQHVGARGTESRGLETPAFGDGRL